MPDVDPLEKLARMSELDLDRFAKKLLRKLARRVGGPEARVSVRRAVHVDADTFELVIDDRIETRIRPPASIAAHLGVHVTPPSGDTNSGTGDV